MKMGQYEGVLCSGHPRENRDHMVYVHVLAAEKKLGRFLKSDETVHHIDKNKTNNNLDNLLVFHTKGDHTSFHRNGCDMSTILQLEDGSYIGLLLTTRCPICGEKKSYGAEKCVNCRMLEEGRNTKCPDKDSLLKQIKNFRGNFCALGRFYGVTDNSVRKWCRRYGLPSHSKDYRD